MFGGKKTKELHDLIENHFEIIEKVLNEFRKMLGDYLALDKQFKEEAYQIHKMEHDADQVRHQVERKLYEGALLPIYRQDYLMLAETADKIANRAEAVGDFIVLTRPPVPEELKEEIVKLVDDTIDAFEPLKRVLDLHISDQEGVLEAANIVAERERVVDKSLWYLTKKVFKSDMQKADKLHLKQLLDLIGSISNIMEDAADQFEIMAVKRKL